MSALVLRVGYRAIRVQKMGGKSSHSMKKVLLVGGGETGNAVLQDIARESKRRYDVVCIVDDDLSKIGRSMQRVKVEGSTNDIPRLVEKYAIGIIILAMPKLSGENKKRITSICASTKCQLKKVPDLYSLVTQSSSILREMQNVSIEDLLGRDVIELPHTDSSLRGKVVLITGAGGSIGSELCRQIILARPKVLIMLDVYENGVYDLEQELRAKCASRCTLVVEIASVQDKPRIDYLFARYHPQIVFHAAAHKHVPMMERMPSEAIKNNVIGTLNVAKCADAYGVEKFVLISTDKAVNPTNVMGATKRVCEMIVQSMNGRSKTEYVAVRFGNVLGSNGSVVPLFKRQIADGGPVTVTDTDVVRYFMTIPEAVSLVLAAGEMATGGEIFVLDMGQPIKILHLAESVIRLSGYDPYTDIDIQIVGMRPGEKMYEELLFDPDQLCETDNDRIFVEQVRPVDTESLQTVIQQLQSAANANDDQQVVALLRHAVPEYVPPAKNQVLPED